MSVQSPHNLSEKSRTRDRRRTLRRRSLDELPASAGNVGTRPITVGRDNLPAWQRERSLLLQTACERVKARQARGNGLLRSIRAVARSFNGRMLKSDLSRKLKLSAKTLTNFFYAWRSSGERIEVFTPRYTYRHSLFTSLVMSALPIS